MEETKKKKIINFIPSLLMVGCLFIGVIVGLIYQKVEAGILIGLGTGLIVMSILRFIRNKREQS